MTEAVRILVGDCGKLLAEMPDNSVDLVLCSPPYEDCRTYGLGKLPKGQAWVDWAVPLFRECCRVSRGLVAWVIEGRTRKFQWSATPVLFMADLHRAGVKLRKPPIYSRVGIPGSGGPDWLRNDYEPIVCASHGKLPWSDNKAMGNPCKHPPGGAMSNRTVDGQRRNARTGTRLSRGRPKTDIANPGNIVHCVVGGGQMGDPLAHENEAPFPESLAEFFIRSFCPPGGVVLDPFGGSGTTAAVAMKHGRRAISIDIRDSQADIQRRRIAGVMGTQNTPQGEEQNNETRG
jgi:site-specific DNA-methyltransferase (adenine-specific)